MRVRILGFVLVCAAGAWAWQDSLGQLKLNRETFERLITDYVNESVNQDQVAMPSYGAAVKDSLLAISDGGRALIVKELGLAAKAFVMSAAFQTSYEAYIKKAYRAVNHGITEKANENVMLENYRQGVIQRLPSLALYDQSTIEMMANTDAGMVDGWGPQTAAEKAAVAKAKTMLGEAKKLAGTDIAKARETYKAALMTAAGLKDEADAKAYAGEADRKEEQQRYNDRILKPLLKKKLLAFAAVVKTVDFKAATAPKNNKQVFVNPAYERKDALWKMLYRLGPGGANAAAQVAQQWATEL